MRILQAPSRGWKKRSVACAPEPASLSLRCWTSGGFHHHPSLRLTSVGRLELFSVTSRNCVNAAALLVSPSGEASAKVALGWWTARGPRKNRGESSPFGLSVLLRREAPVGLHQIASRRVLFSGCRRQAFACPSQGAPKGTLVPRQHALQHPRGSRRIPRCLPTQGSSGQKSCALTSLLTQRRGRKFEFQNIQVFRNQHAIHHGYPHLSKTYNCKDTSTNTLNHELT